MTLLTSAEMESSTLHTPSPKRVSASSYSLVTQPGSPVTASHSPTTKPLAPECRSSTQRCTSSRWLRNSRESRSTSASQRAIAVRESGSSRCCTWVWVSVKIAWAWAETDSRVWVSCPTIPPWRSATPRTVPPREALSDARACRWRLAMSPWACTIAACCCAARSTGAWAAMPVSSSRPERTSLYGGVLASGSVECRSMRDWSAIVSTRSWSASRERFSGGIGSGAAVVAAMPGSATAGGGGVTGVPVAGLPVGVPCRPSYDCATRLVSPWTAVSSVPPAALAAPWMSALVSSSSSAGRRSRMAVRIWSQRARISGLGGGAPPSAAARSAAARALASAVGSSTAPRAAAVVASAGGRSRAACAARCAPPPTAAMRWTWAGPGAAGAGGISSSTGWAGAVPASADDGGIGTDGRTVVGDGARLQRLGRQWRREWRRRGIGGGPRPGGVPGGRGGCGRQGRSAIGDSTSAGTSGVGSVRGASTSTAPW